MSTTTPTSRGLEDIVAGSSAICYIDGKNGVLAYRGIDIHDLADNATFEEVTYLLWHGTLPTRKELAEFSLQLVRERKLDAQIISFLRQVPKHALPMDVCRTIVSALSFFDPEEKVNTKEANYNKSQRLFSQTGMIVASYDRIRKGLPLIEPDRSLSYAGNFLLMLNGVRPSETAIRALDTSLILTADHEWNASTFAARVTAATLSDMHSAVTSGIGALKGPLHGGANEAVMKLLETDQRARRRPGGIRKGNDRAEDQDSRLRPSCVHHRRSACYAPAPDVARPGLLERKAEVVRRLQGDRGVHQLGEEAECERRLLLCFGLSHAGH